MSNGDQLQQVVQGIETLLAEGMDIGAITVRVIEEAGYSTRKVMENLGGLNLIKKNFFPNVEKDLRSKVKLASTSSYISKLEKQAGNALLANDALAEAINNLKSVSIKSYKGKAKSKIERMVTLVLSDLHIGSDVKKEETGHLDFGRIEESRRLAKLIQETIDYKPQYREQTQLNVLLLGDLICGNLGHDLREGAPLAEQVARAIDLLSQGLLQLAQHFPKINVVSITGNHDRITSRHPNRAVQSKWDSYQTMIAFALKKILANCKNVEFTIPKTPFAVVNLFNKKLFASHGDTVLKVGYPGSSINTKNLEGQINKINATLPDADEYSVVVVGHLHTPAFVHMANGAVLLTNGAMIPSDEFAVSIGLMENVCGQFLFESIKDYPFGDVRFIKLSKKDDEDKSLDAIIKPFSGF